MSPFSMTTFTPGLAAIKPPNSIGLHCWFCHKRTCPEEPRMALRNYGGPLCLVCESCLAAQSGPWKQRADRGWYRACWTDEELAARERRNFVEKSMERVKKQFIAEWLAGTIK